MAQRFLSDINLGDNIYLRFGNREEAGSVVGDFTIRHSGANTFLTNSTGSLVLKNTADDKGIAFMADNGNGGATTYFELEADQSTYDTNTSSITALYTTWGDNSRIALGTGRDLEIYHNGYNSFISNSTGNLYIRNDANDKDIYFQGDDGNGSLTNYFYIDGSTTKIEVVKEINSASGATFAGDVTISANTPELLFADTDNNTDAKLLANNGNVGIFSDINQEYSDSIIYFNIDGTERARFDGSGYHFRPGADSTYDLGLDATRWRNVYADTYYGDGSNLTGISTTDSTKLPLTGGTLTGDLTLSKASTPIIKVEDTTNNHYLFMAADDNNSFMRSDGTLLFQVGAASSTVTALNFASDGDATFGGNNINIDSGGGTPSLKITRNLGSGISPGVSLGFINIENSASTGSDNRAVIFEGFTDGGSANATGGGLRLYTKNASTGSNTVAITVSNNNNVTLHGSPYTNTIYSLTNSAYYIDVVASGTGLNMAGSATIAGSVTANSFIKSGGTSSQYLMADGSVSTGVASHNHDDRYYTETEIDSNFYGKVAIDAKFTSSNGTEDEWKFTLGDESNLTGNKWYKVATINQGAGGLHIKGSFSNHVESFGTQHIDLLLQGREGNSGDEIEINGTVNVIHNAGTGTDKVGIRVIEADTTTSQYYHYYDVYMRTTRYTQAKFHLTKFGTTAFHTSKPSVTSEPAPASGGSVELDTSTLASGNHVIVDSVVKSTIADSTGYVGLGIDPTSNQRLNLAEADANGSHIKMTNSRSGGGYWVTGVGDSASSSSIVDPGGLFFYNGSTKLKLAANGSATFADTITVNGDNINIPVESTTNKYLYVANDSDYGRAYIGRAFVGKLGWDDHAGFAHVDHNSQSNYALLQSNDGSTYINTPTGKTAYFRVNNSTIGSYSSTGLRFSKFFDLSDTNYYLDLNSTSTSLNAAGSAIFAGDVTLGSGSSETRTLTLQTNAEKDSIINFKESTATYGFSIGYYGVANDFIIKRHDNSTNGVAVLTMFRENNNVTFAEKVRANSWFQGADGTNTLYSNATAGTVIQTAGNTANNNDSKIYFRNSATTVKHTFDTNNGNASFTGSVIATGAVQVPYAASTKKPMIVLQNATTYGLFHTEASDDIFSFDFNGSSKHQFKQDGTATFTGDTFTPGLYVNTGGSAVSGTQVAIVSSGGSENLQRWGSSTSGGHSYRFRIDQNFKFIGNNGGADKITIDSATGDIDTDGDVTIGGNLTVNGTQTILNTETVEVEDNILVLNKTNTSMTATTSGISVYRGASAAASFIFDDSDDYWDLTHNLKVAGTTYLDGFVTIDHNLDITSSGVIRMGGTEVISAARAINATSGTFSGNITHNGLTMTDGTDVDQVKEYSMTFQLTANSWTDTGIDGTDLTTGTYIVQMYVDDHNAGGGHYDEYYSGTISWWSGSTNSTNVDEIILHRAGHASNNSDIQLRTQRASGTDTHDLMLLVKSNYAHSAAMNNTDGRTFKFKFRRLI